MVGQCRCRWGLAFRITVRVTASAQPPGSRARCTSAPATAALCAPHRSSHTNRPVTDPNRAHADRRLPGSGTRGGRTPLDPAPCRVPKPTPPEPGTHIPPAGALCPASRRPRPPGTQHNVPACRPTRCTSGLGRRKQQKCCRRGPGATVAPGCSLCTSPRPLTAGVNEPQRALSKPHCTTSQSTAWVGSGQPAVDGRWDTVPSVTALRQPPGALPRSPPTASQSLDGTGGGHHLTSWFHDRCIVL